jgi:hypothetical protein
MFWEASPPVRTRDETGRSVIGSELVDHQDEADERPVGGVAPHVRVQFLRGRAWPQRPRQKRTELEWTADHGVARPEQGWEHVDVVECTAAIHEVAHSVIAATV